MGVASGKIVSRVPFSQTLPTPLVLVLVKLKSEEERAEHVWGYAEGGMTRGLAVVRDVCTLLFALCFYFRTSLV